MQKLAGRNPKSSETTNQQTVTNGVTKVVVRWWQWGQPDMPLSTALCGRKRDDLINE